MRVFPTVFAALLAAVSVVIAGRTTSATCESYTLKCSTSKTAWAGKTTKVSTVLYHCFFEHLVITETFKFSHRQRLKPLCTARQTELPRMSKSACGGTTMTFPIRNPSRLPRDIQQKHTLTNCLITAWQSRRIPWFRPFLVSINVHQLQPQSMLLQTFKVVVILRSSVLWWVWP